MTFEELLRSFKGNDRVYEALLDQVKAHCVTPVFGAGMSVWSNYPLWKKLLSDMASNTTIPPETKKNIEKLLESEHFEQAASMLEDKLGSHDFQERVKTEYNVNKLNEENRPIYQYLLPELFKNFIVTTNFDMSLERLFKFDTVIVPEDPYQRKQIGALIQTNSSKTLVKLHGSINDISHIVLTEARYNQVYGSKPDSPDLNLLLPKTLYKIFHSAHPLFLGCGLGSDRTSHVLRQCAEDGLKGFALVSLPEETQNKSTPFEPTVFNENGDDYIPAFKSRKAFLDQMGIQVIWYPYGEHDAVRVLVEKLAEDEGIRNHQNKSFSANSVIKAYQEDNYSFCYKPGQLKLIGVERKKILKDIVDWANTDNEIGMSAILGAPGCGKSRLAFEVWRELEQQGWNALWIDRLLTDELVIQENLKQFSGNVLIVVDDVQFCTLIFATVLRCFLSSNSVERRGISKVRFVITAYEECEEIKFYSRFLGQEGNYCSYELKMLENSEIGELIGNYINTRNDLLNLNIAATKESIIKKLEDDTIGESAPLYALFMAEAICSGKNIENWAQKDILDYVISIENSKIEKALEDMQLSAYQKPLYRNAVRTIRMIATLTGGVQYDLLTTISHLPALSILADYNHKTQIKELLKRANLIESERSVVVAMKPDIMGGIPCVNSLAGRREF